MSLLFSASSVDEFQARPETIRLKSFEFHSRPTVIRRRHYLTVTRHNIDKSQVDPALPQNVEHIRANVHAVRFESYSVKTSD
jgi:hypothetical protein